MPWNHCDYQAVVFAAGSGSRMTDLTETIPKCLLPVANLPLIWYSLAYLDRNSIKDVILIIPEKYASDICRLINEQCPPLSLNIDFVSLSASQTETWATADALRYVADRIKGDFLVISGDFVSDFPLQKVLNFHRNSGSSMTCLLAEKVTVGPAPGQRIRRPKIRDFIALESNSNCIAFLGSEDDLDENVTFSARLLNKFDNLLLTANYVDCHFYISSIKADLIPYIIERQYADFNTEMISNEFDELNSLIEKLSFIKPENDANLSACFAMIIKNSDTKFTFRCNTVATYFELNKNIVPFLDDFLLSASVELHNLSRDFLIGEPFQSGEKCHIKRSVIGRHCTLGARVKIINSVLMDHVSVYSGATVTNSILCHGSEVGENCQVKDSIVAIRERVRPEEIIIAETVTSAATHVMHFD